MFRRVLPIAFLALAALGSAPDAHAVSVGPFPGLTRVDPPDLVVFGLDIQFDPSVPSLLANDDPFSPIAAFFDDGVGVDDNFFPVTFFADTNSFFVAEGANSLLTGTILSFDTTPSTFSALAIVTGGSLAGFYAPFSNRAILEFGGASLTGGSYVTSGGGFVDIVSATAIPLPGGLVLLLSGIGLFGLTVATRRRR